MLSGYSQRVLEELAVGVEVAGVVVLKVFLHTLSNLQYVLGLSLKGRP